MEELERELTKYMIKDISNIVIEYYTKSLNISLDEIKQEYLFLALSNYAMDGNYIMVKCLLERFGKEKIINLNYALSNSGKYPQISNLLKKHGAILKTYPNFIN